MRTSLILYKWFGPILRIIAFLIRVVHSGPKDALRYERFLRLRSTAQTELQEGRYDRAEALSIELLDLAELYKDDWNHGNAVHHAYGLLGLKALRTNDINYAVTCLLKSGKVTGSPQLNTFGPNMLLAEELLKAGQAVAVLEYLDLCKRFWTRGQEEIEEWSTNVRKGSMPDFGVNLSL